MVFWFCGGVSIEYATVGESRKDHSYRDNDKVCFTVLSEPAKNPGEWWNCFTSVICFGRISEVKGEERKNELLRRLGNKLFPAGYDIEADMAKNAHRALILELTIDHLSGKHVREK